MTQPITPSRTSRASLVCGRGHAEREARAAAMRADLDALAAQSRTRDAAALRTVLAYTSAGMHKDLDGHSGILQWLRECFDFTHTTASQIARIARLAPKFQALAHIARTGAARIDAVAYAMLALDRKGLRVHARLPYPDGPKPSPYDPAVQCATPEALIGQYCVHAPHTELREAIDQITAALFDQAAMMDHASQQALAHLEVTERPDGMWDLEGILTADTGRLLDKYLQTAITPPRQDEADTDGVLPSQANRAAEAFHQLVAAAGTAKGAPTRHGHTATLSLIADVQVLKGETALADHPERTPRLEGAPISLTRARHLACEAGVVPMVFDYEQGEAVELGRTERLPTTALRRKLEAEQATGCAWRGCGRPVSWLEAHHLDHWLDGGPTNADNLILVCRFHHGRLHTDRWHIEKTGPGTATITRKGCTPDTPCQRCPACADAGRIVKPLVDTDDLSAAFDIDLEREEWSPLYRTELDALAQYGTDKAIAAAMTAHTRTHDTHQTPAPKTTTETTETAETAETVNGTTEATEVATPPSTAPAEESDPTRERKPNRPTNTPSGDTRPTPAPPHLTGERWSTLDPIPFLPRPRQAAPAEGTHRNTKHHTPHPIRVRPHPHVRTCLEGANVQTSRAAQRT